MSRHLSTVTLLEDQRWVPVLRTSTVADAVATARACRAGGCRAVELTHSTPDVAEAVRELVADGMVVGVGTVRTPAQVEEAAAAGASFVVSFYRPPGFLAAARDCGVLAVPGALTPQEVGLALDEGAQMLKLFSARLLTPAYLGDLKAVVGPVPLVVSGGVPADAEGVRTWLEAGAAWVAIGGQLGLCSEQGADAVRERASALTSAVSSL